MSSDRRTILALVAMGRITPGQAERLIAAWNDSRETAWILAASLAFAVLTQIHLRELVTGLMRFFNTQVPPMAEAMRHALSLITDPMGGLL